MCTYGQMLFTDGKKEGMVEGEAKGKAAGKVEANTLFVVKMLRKQEPLDKIHEYTELPMNEILKIAAENNIHVKTCV